MHLFTYGTLMFPEVWKAVLGNIVVGREFKTTPAQLPGYQIFRMRDALYPGIIKSSTPPCSFPLPPYSASGSRPSALDSRLFTVPGLVYFDVDPASLARLDRFEGDDYRRISVGVTTAEQGKINADTYVIAFESRHLLTDEPWIAAEFQRRGDLNRFIAKYSGFQRLD